MEDEREDGEEEHEGGEEEHEADDSDAGSSDSGSARLSDGDGNGDYENEPAFERAAGDRTRRCDHTLRLRVRAARALRQQLAPTRSLGGGQTRDLHVLLTTLHSGCDTPRVQTARALLSRGS